MKVATKEDRARGQALLDSIDHLRRAIAALEAAADGADPFQRGGLNEVLEQLQTSLRALRLIA